MKNLRRSMFFLMLAALLFAGCNEKYDPITDQAIQELTQAIPASSDGYETFVSLEQATSVAEAFFGKTALKPQQKERRKQTLLLKWSGIVTTVP